MGPLVCQCLLVLSQGQFNYQGKGIGKDNGKNTGKDKGSSDDWGTWTAAGQGNQGTNEGEGKGPGKG